MKKILFISSLNLNRRDGGSLATLGYYNALCKLYPGKVDIIMPKEDCYGKFTNAIGIPKRNVFDLFCNFSIHRGYRFLKNYIRKYGHEYSICIINISRTAGDLMDEFRAVGLKTIVIHHNYEVEYTMDNKHMYTLWGLCPLLVSKIESNAYKKADVNCFLTISDMESISKAYGSTEGRNYLLGVFEKELTTYTFSKSENNNIMVFTGSMCDYQTYHSAVLFEKEYFPILIKKYPNLKMIIAGRNPHNSIWRFQQKYPKFITVISNPPNMDVVLEQASIFLCPTCIGSGIKLRIMDGLKKGLPVLVHRISARGYEAFESKPYFQVYDDERTFITGLDIITTYIKNTKNYKNIIIQDYCAYFGFESGVQKMKKIIETIEL